MRALAFLILVLSGMLVSAQEITVAAAADLQLALRQITQKYETSTGRQVRVSFGSSGNLVSQIENGAPYDVFFSADVGYADQLVVAGRALPASKYEYAVGRLVLWAPANSPLDVQRGMSVLTDPLVRKIAIANPQHAPYGRAAVQALKAAGIYDQVKQKLVLGENISQTEQFVSSGNADVGLVSLSLVAGPSDATPKGKYWLIPDALYRPIRQAAIVIKGKHEHAAEQFLGYVKSREAREILKEYGFAPATE